MKLYEGIRGGTYFLRGGQKVYVSSGNFSGGIFGSNTVRALETIINEYPQWLPLIYELCWQLFHYYSYYGYYEVPEATITSPQQLIDFYNKLKTHEYRAVFLKQKERFKNLIQEISQDITRGYDPSNTILYVFNTGQKYVTRYDYFMRIKPELISNLKAARKSYENRASRGFIPHHP